MPAHSHSFRTEIGKDVSAVVFVDHTGSATHVTGLARVAGWMPVAGANPVAGTKARWGIGRHRRRGTADHGGSDFLRWEEMLAEVLIGQLRRFAGCQLLHRHQTRFYEQFLQ